MTGIGTGIALNPLVVYTIDTEFLLPLTNLISFTVWQ